MVLINTENFIKSAALFQNDFPAQSISKVDRVDDFINKYFKLTDLNLQEIYL